MRSPLLTAFLNPLNLAMLALAAAAGLCAAWWLFPLGLLVWAVMFMQVYRDPSLQFSQVIHSRAPLAQRFQSLFDRIERSQISLFNNLASAKPNVRSILQPLQEAVNQLTDQSYQVCLRMTTLQNYYLVTKTNRDLDGELFNQKVKIDNATDEATKHEYEESRKALEEQVKNFHSIGALLDRVEAQLTNVSSTLDSVMADTLRMQMLKPEDIARELPAVLQSIQAQSTQLASFIQEAASSKI